MCGHGVHIWSKTKAAGNAQADVGYFVRGYGEELFCMARVRVSFSEIRLESVSWNCDTHRCEFGEKINPQCLTDA